LEEEPFAVVVVEGAFVVVFVVFGAVDCAAVFGAASTVTASAAAATHAAGRAIHLVIAPPAETVEQSAYLTWRGGERSKLLIKKG